MVLDLRALKKTAFLEFSAYNFLLNFFLEELENEGCFVSSTAIALSKALRLMY